MLYSDLVHVTLFLYLLFMALSCSPGPYLIVITRKRLVGYIQGNEVWKVLGTEVLPFPKATLHLTEEQVILSYRHFYNYETKNYYLIIFISYHIIYRWTIYCKYNNLTPEICYFDSVNQTCDKPSSFWSAQMLITLISDILCFFFEHVVLGWSHYDMHKISDGRAPTHAISLTCVVA